MAAQDGPPEEIIFFSTLSILQVIKEAQQQHGLRHNDYQRYRAYCARRVRRVRKSLHFTHTHKSVPKHPAKFTQKKIQLEVVNDDRYLLVPLFEAERAWAYGMQLKQEMAAEENLRKKYHMITRLRKAYERALNLESLCKTLKQVDAQTKLEASAYSAWIGGYLYFELQDWPKAMENFTTSKTIYTKLSGVVKDPNQKEAFTARVSEMSPQLRFCAYNIGDKSAIDEIMKIRKMNIESGGAAVGDDLMANDVEKLVADALEKQKTDGQNTTVWAGHSIDLSQPRKLATFAGSYQQFVKDLAETTDIPDQISLYDKILIEVRDAIQIVRDETMKTDGNKLLGDASLVNSYLVYLRLSLTNERYSLMLAQAKNESAEGKRTKPQDMIRLYDTIMQNLTEMLNLHGIDNDKALPKDIKQKSAYYKAFRCFWVGEAFLATKKYGEALALFDRTQSHVNVATKQLKGHPNAKELTAGLHELSGLVNGAKHRANASALFARTEASSPVKTETYDKALLDDLERYRKNWNVTELVGVKGPSITADLAKMPPDFKPMPGKPLFFDLAFNHIKFPDLESKIEPPQQQKKKSDGKNQSQGSAAESMDTDEQSAGGISGLVKGWFWGGKK